MANYTDDQRRSLLAAWHKAHAAGETAAGFCARHSLPQRTLRSWTSTSRQPDDALQRARAPVAKAADALASILAVLNTGLGDEAPADDRGLPGPSPTAADSCQSADPKQMPDSKEAVPNEAEPGGTSERRAPAEEHRERVARTDVPVPPAPAAAPPPQVGPRKKRSRGFFYGMVPETVTPAPVPPPISNTAPPPATPPQTATGPKPMPNVGLLSWV